MKHINPIIRLVPIVHRENPVVKLEFAYNDELHRLTKGLPGCRWSKTMKAWYLPKKESIIKDCFVAFKGKAWIDYTAMKREPTNLLAAENGTAEPDYKQETVNAGNTKLVAELAIWMKVKRYSDSSIISYTVCLNTFMKWCGQKAFEDLERQDIVAFNAEYILKRGLSATYQSHFVSSIKLLLRVCKQKGIEAEDLERPKRAKKLPNVLNKAEIRNILEQTANVKHKTMLSLIYSAGLRCGELLKMKIADIDTERMLLHIRFGKGQKDRIVPLSKRVKDLIECYRLQYQPGLYLFEGAGGREQYDERSLQQVLKQAVARAGINKPVTLHWLRHSYATHLLEGGTNLRYIQELLGHKNSKTTEIYTHIGKRSLETIVSPLDDL